MAIVIIKLRSTGHPINKLPENSSSALGPLLMSTLATPHLTFIEALST